MALNTRRDPGFVLVATNDETATEAMRRGLVRAGFEVAALGSGCAARALARTRRVDLAIVDLGLDDVDGFDLLAELRESADLPVIAVGAAMTDAECILGLQCGADDYLSKPISAMVLAARAEALLRRVHETDKRELLSFGNISIDVSAQEVRVGGQLVDLTAKEFALLEALARHPRTVFSRRDLLKTVWNSDPAYQSPATVTEYVRRVRNKVQNGDSGSARISTVRGIGYRFDP